MIINYPAFVEKAGQPKKSALIRAKLHEICSFNGFFGMDFNSKLSSFGSTKAIFKIEKPNELVVFSLPSQFSCPCCETIVRPIGGADLKAVRGGETKLAMANLG